MPHLKAAVRVIGEVNGHVGIVNEDNRVISAADQQILESALNIKEQVQASFMGATYSVIELDAPLTVYRVQPFSDKDCCLVTSDVQPTRDTMDQLNMSSERGYIRWEDKLYYVDQDNNIFNEIRGMDSAKLAAFDDALSPSADSVTLTSDQLTEVRDISGHDQIGSYWSTGLASLNMSKAV